MHTAKIENLVLYTDICLANEQRKLFGLQLYITFILFID